MAITDEIIRNLQSEIILLRNEIKELREIIMPTIELSDEEVKELDKIDEEMNNGEYVKLEELDLNV